MSNDSVKVSLEIATQAAEMALKRVKEQTKETTGAFEVMKGVIGGSAFLGAVKALGAGLSGVFSSAIDNAINAQNEVNDLSRALANAGNYSQGAVTGLLAFADSMEQVSIYSSGAISANLALLESMTGLSEDGLKRAQSAAIELASVFNIDLAQATELVGKAHNGNTASLKKLGLQFDDARTSAGTYENILQEIEKRQGTAQGKTNTYSGAMAQASNSMDKLLAATGSFIVSNPVFATGIQAASNAMQSLANTVQSASDFVRENSGAFEILGAGLAAASIALVAVAAKALIAAGAFTALATTAAAAWAAVTAPVTIVVAAVAAVGAGVYALYKYWDDVRSAAYNALAATLEFAAKGANAIGASGKAKLLEEQAQKYRDLGQAAKDLANAEREAEKSKTETVKFENNERTKVKDDEAKKRDDELTSYVQKLAKQSEDIKAEYDRRAEYVRIANEQNALNESEADKINFEAKLQRERDYYLEKQLLLEQELAAETARINSSKATDDEKYKARLTVQQKFGLDSAKLQLDLNQKQQGIQKAQLEFEKKMNELKVQSASATFGNLSSLMASGNRKLFEIGKASAIAQATINAAMGISNALAGPPTGPPFPFNIALAASQGVSLGVQLSSLMKAQPPAFAQGGIVPGNSFTGDRVTALVNSGEMVLNKNQQKTLFDVANGQGGGNQNLASQVAALSSQVVALLNQPISIQVDGKEIVSVMRSQLAAGRSF